MFSNIGYLNLALICAKPFLPRGMKLVVEEQSTRSVRLAYEVGYSQAWKWLYRRLYRRADLVVCPSQATLDDLAEHFNVPRRKLIRIYNPVDVHQVKRLAALGENPYPTPGPNLVAVARLSREKGIDVLLEAFALVREVICRARLTVLGEGPLASALCEQRDRLGLGDSVHFVGFQPNPHPYVRYADIFVMPSRVEGMPNAVLEALALGKPVVATDCAGGIREIAEANRRLTLVSSEDSSALAEGVISVLLGTKSEEFLESDSRFEQKFDVRPIMSQYETLFETVYDGTFL